MTDTGNARQLIADTLRRQARWRETKAAGHRHELRNQRWADAAEACAAYVETLPSSDQRIRTIAAAYYLTGPGQPETLHLGPEASEFTARCDLTPDLFLTELSRVVVDETVRDEDTLDQELYPDD